jgi:hypothetical protein
MIEVLYYYRFIDLQYLPVVCLIDGQDIYNVETFSLCKGILFKLHEAAFIFQYINGIARHIVYITHIAKKTCLPLYIDLGQATGIG